MAKRREFSPESLPPFNFGDLPVPKIHDLQLAQELLARGLIGSIEDIYEPLTPELEQRLAESRLRWAGQEQFLTNNFEWDEEEEK